jgi:rod shape-determining protein MreC
MTLRQRILDYTVAGILLLVPAALLHSQFRQPSQLSAVDRGILQVSAPLQSAVSWVVEGIGGLWGRYLFLVGLEHDNRALREEVGRLRIALASAQQRAREADSLEALVALKRVTAAPSTGARVIAAGVNPSFRVARVAVEAGAGLLVPGMPVVAPEGLVGRVHRTFGSDADLLLLTDSQSSVDVVVPRTGGRGILTGLGRDSSYACQIQYLERGEEVRVGDPVVTSGLGQHFPAGLPVGRVSRVLTKEYGLYQEVEVEPAVDFARLRHVLILLAPPPVSPPHGPAEPPVLPRRPR